MTIAADLTADLVELVPYVPSALAAPPSRLREIAFRADAWLPDEDATLRRMFAADSSIAEMAASIGRPFQGIRSRICVLGLRRNSTRPWLPEEDAELLARYGAEPCASIAQDLGRSVAAVYAHANLLGLTEDVAADWDEWEDEQLRAGYAAGVPVGQIAALIGRPLLGARSRATILGLRHPSQPPGWTDEEATRALELAEQGHRYLAIIEMLVVEGFPRRSKSGFSQRLRLLGYGRGWGRAWSADEEELLRRAYDRGDSIAQLANRLGRSRSTLMWKAGELGLSGTHAGGSAGWRSGKRCWSADEEATLRAEYGKTPNKDLARKLDRNWSAVRVRANALGLVHGWMRAFTPDEDRAILIAWRCGVSITDLCHALNRDPSVVGKRCRRRHGVSFSDPGRPARAPRTRIETRRKLTLQQILALEEPAAGQLGIAPALTRHHLEATVSRQEAA